MGRRCRAVELHHRRPRRFFFGGGWASTSGIETDCCSGCAAVLRRERISIQTSNAIEMAVNPPTRM